MSRTASPVILAALLLALAAPLAAQQDSQRPVEPRRVEPRQQEPRQVEPRRVEPRRVEPRREEPRVEPRRVENLDDDEELYPELRRRKPE